MKNYIINERELYIILDTLERAEEELKAVDEDAGWVLTTGVEDGLVESYQILHGILNKQLKQDVGL